MSLQAPMQARIRPLTTLPTHRTAPRAACSSAWAPAHFPRQTCAAHVCLPDAKSVGTRSADRGGIRFSCSAGACTAALVAAAAAARPAGRGATANVTTGAGTTPTAAARLANAAGRAAAAAAGIADAAAATTAAPAALLALSDWRIAAVVASSPIGSA